MHKAARLWLCSLIALLGLNFNISNAQTGVYTFGTDNANEGGRVLCDDPVHQRMYIGGYRRDSTLIMMVDYNGYILGETTFMVSDVGARDILTDLKFSANDSFLIGTGIQLPTAGTQYGGYIFRMTRNLVMDWMQDFPTGTNSLLPKNIQDLGTNFTYYVVMGACYPNYDASFLRVDKQTGTTITNSTHRYDVGGPEDFEASVIQGQDLFITGRLGHSGGDMFLRPGLVRMNGTTGTIIPNNQHTYLVDSVQHARLYSTDVALDDDGSPVTIGNGDFHSNGFGLSSFFSIHNQTTNELAGWEIDIADFQYEEAAEVIRAPGMGLGSFVIFGQGRLNGVTTNGHSSNQLWMMSINRNGTTNWFRQYGGSGIEFYDWTSQQQLISINSGTARLAFAATTIAPGETDENILLVMANAYGEFDAIDGNCISSPIGISMTSHIHNNTINMVRSDSGWVSNTVTPMLNHPALHTQTPCGPSCFAAMEPSFSHITVPMTFNQTNTPSGRQVWAGKVYVGADVTIDGIVLDISESDIVFAPCTRITLINGARLEANNSTFRSCGDNDSWEGIFFTSTGTTHTSGAVDGCLFKNAVDAIRLESAPGNKTAAYDVRITDNSFVTCLHGIRMPGVARLNMLEGITGNRFTVDNRPIVWGSKNPNGQCITSFSQEFEGISAVATTFVGQVSQNSFINTSDVATTTLGGIIWNNCIGRISLNQFTNNRHAVQMNRGTRAAIENNAIEVTQRFAQFETQILLVGTTNSSVLGNHLINSNEAGTFNRYGAAISIEIGTFINVKENTVDGFTNGIQFYGCNHSAIDENKLTNCNVVGIVVQGGASNTVSCNEIKMRLQLDNAHPSEGIFYNHLVSSLPSVDIRGNCITDASFGIVANNQSNLMAMPRMRNNYLYNYTRGGIVTFRFNGAQGTGIATPAQAGRNTFVSNNVLGGAVDIHSNGQSQTWYGNYGISTVSAGVTLIGNGTYHSIASCGLQIGSGNSAIGYNEVCDQFTTGPIQMLQRLISGDYSEFESDKFGDAKAVIAAALTEALLDGGSADVAAAFKAWIGTNVQFLPAEKAWVNYHYHNAMGESDAALAALVDLQNADSRFKDFVTVESIDQQLALHGRAVENLTDSEINELAAIDNARLEFADDARDWMHVGIGAHPHLLKAINLPEIALEGRHIQDVRQESLHLFPNPAETQVTVEYVLDNALGGSLRIFDIAGKMMYQAPLAGDASSTTLDLTTWSPGIYLLSLFNSEGQVSTAKLIVK